MEKLKIGQYVKVKRFQRQSPENHTERGERYTNEFGVIDYIHPKEYFYTVAFKDPTKSEYTVLYRESFFPDRITPQRLPKNYYKKQKPVLPPKKKSV